MKRPLLYLFIFTLFAWSILISLVFTSSPLNEDGSGNRFIVASFIIAFFLASTLLFALILSLIQNFLPNHKLPHLLIRDSLIQGALLSFGLSGLLVLQLLRAATPLNVFLWVAIVVAVVWIIKEMRSTGNSEITPRQTIQPITRRRR
jgi:ABC-type transport system involved in multi-copper enzyme maturation permease subunit